MNVISNSGPLISLSIVGYLHILHALYGKVLVPVAVMQEVVVCGKGRPGSSEVEDAPWIQKVNVENRFAVQLLRGGNRDFKKVKCQGDGL